MRTEIAGLGTVNPESRLKAVVSSVNVQVHSPGWTVVVGVAMAAIYLALVPYLDRTWRTTGDEPHYLLAAHSLVTDLDLNLANNYDQLDYLSFYFSQDIERQIRTNGAGQQILNHQLGLPVMIAPAYALGGRAGVLIFEAILGGVLAAITFKLAVLVSRDEKAALAATVVVMLSPPLLMYHYLVYPEMLGGLITTLVLYVTIAKNRPTVILTIVVMMMLMTLPWLSRRYVPLSLLLALLLAWAWRKPSRSPWAGMFWIVATLFSVFLLWWFQSQLNQPLRADIIAPPDATVFWSRLGRGIGWLVDQQRGLFIFAPVYMLTLWGVPFVIHDSYRHSNRHWFVVLPFLVTLGVTILAAGYWVPWELGPRPLVVALPAMAPLLALPWRHYGRHKIWVGLALVLVAVSLANSLVIIRHSELPYKSSLPIFYSEQLGLPLTEVLPDLAGHARIFPGQPNQTSGGSAMEDGELVWFVGAGQPVTIAQSGPLHQLPYGHYRLAWPVRAEPDLPPNTELFRLSARFAGGGALFYKTVSAADLPVDGSYGLVEYSFINPRVDRWRTPLLLRAVSTGESHLWSQTINVSPQPFYAWFLPYLCLALILAAVVISWYKIGQAADSFMARSHQPLFTWPNIAGWTILLALLAGVAAYLIYQHNLASRTYEIDQLHHLVGRPAADPAARGTQAWLVDPQSDPPQKAIYGPFEIYDRGQYDVTFRLKLPRATAAGRVLARLQVRDATGTDLFTQPIRADHFSKSNLYHDFVLVVNNPRRQALSFEVDYLGVAAIAIDEVTITELTH